jgi:hypothetical protein
LKAASFCFLEPCQKLKVGPTSSLHEHGGMMLVRVCLAFLLAFVFSFDLAFAAQSTPKKAALPAVKPDPEMTFQIMRASNATCEPNCPEWIYAEGRIVGSTAEKFNQVLRRAERKPLLLVIQSGGGDVRAALNMGRALRANKMNVAVGYSFTMNCATGDDFCAKVLKPKQISKGFLTNRPGFCASACTLVLAAGVERIAVPGSVVGTHQILNKPIFQKLFFREKYLMIHGKKQVISKTITKRETIIGKATTKLAPGFEAELARYIKSMGVGGDFLSFYGKAPPSGIYKMTPAERLATKIVTSQLSPDIYARPEICSGKTAAANCIAIKR